MYPDKLKYTKDHEWIDVQGEAASIGVTFFAQKELGDVVFVELPDVGRRINQNDEFGTIESVKAVSEMYSPASGEVVEVNDALRDKPELVNEDPYEAGWIIKIKLTNPAEIESLMSSAEYEALIGAGGHEG